MLHTCTETSGGARYSAGRFVKGLLWSGNQMGQRLFQQNRGWEAATKHAEGGEGREGSAVVSGIRATKLTRADHREEVWGRGLGLEERNKQSPEVPRSRAFGVCLQQSWDRRTQSQCDPEKNVLNVSLRIPDLT